MGISPVQLFKLLLYSFLWGLAIGAINDALRITRILFFRNISDSAAGKYGIKNFFNKIKTNKAKINLRRWTENTVTVVEDILLMWIYVFGVIFLNYGLNNGDFRFFSVAVSFIGAVLYYFTVGKIVFKMSEKFCAFIKISLFVILRSILRPFVYISTKIEKKIKKFFAFFQNSIAKSNNKSYNKYKEKKLFEDSLSAFTAKNIVVFIKREELNAKK